MLYQKFLHFGVKMVGLDSAILCVFLPPSHSPFSYIPLCISAVEADKLSMGGS